jgi:glutaminase
MMHNTYEREWIKEFTPENVGKVFQEAYENGLQAARSGKCADYIPELAKADPGAFGIYALDDQGRNLSYGDVETRFSIQSISKVINLAVSLKYRGFRDTFSHVMMEPSGDAFNSILKLDTRSNLPFNPMINAGAIQTVSLLVEDFNFDDLLQFAKELCMDPDICLDEAVYHSESDTGDRNRAIAYLLKSKGVLQADPDRTIDLYFRMCSLSVTAKSLAGLGIILANGGVNPFTKKHWLAPGYVRTIKSIMFTCGMYDFSGEFGVRVGIPAKSGVGGGLVCAVKGPYGIGLYGPALDHFGNSVASVTAMEHISHRLGLHVFECTW